MFSFGAHDTERAGLVHLLTTSRKVACTTAGLAAIVPGRSVASRACVHELWKAKTTTKEACCNLTSSGSNSFIATKLQQQP
jgi:hypothetical protein